METIIAIVVLAAIGYLIWIVIREDDTVSDEIINVSGVEEVEIDSQPTEEVKSIVVDDKGTREWWIDGVQVTDPDEIALLEHNAHIIQLANNEGR